MQQLLTNWKTTSAGLVMIGGAIIHLIFAMHGGTADENTWTTTFIAIIGGLGLMLAGDASASVTKTQADTTFVKKVDALPLVDKPTP